MDNNDEALLREIAMLRQQNQHLAANQAHTTKFDSANYFASSSELPPNILEKYFGFLNKDVATTVLSKREIRSQEFMLRAAFIAELLDLPAEQIPADAVHQIENIVSAYMNRALKSKNGLLMRMSLENTETNIVKQELDQKNKWGFR